MDCLAERSKTKRQALVNLRIASGGDSGTAGGAAVEMDEILLSTEGSAPLPAAAVAATAEEGKEEENEEDGKFDMVDDKQQQADGDLDPTQGTAANSQSDDDASEENIEEF